MLKGIHLTLMIGPAVPVPVPQVVLDALTSVQVTVPSLGASTFRLSFTLSKDSPLNTLFIVAGGSSIPLIRVVLIATVNGIPQSLIDGVITNQEFQPGGPGEGSQLTVIGEDLTKVIDYIDFSGTPLPAMPPEARVALLLSKYAAFGVIPLIIPAPIPDVPVPTNRIPIQKGTDLAYIRQLAEEVGYVFYLEPGPAPATSIAYWGPRIKVGLPQPALNLDMDGHSNVQSLSFNYNSQDVSIPVVFIHNELTKAPIPIPIPDISLLNPPLGLIPPIPLRVDLKRGTAKLPPARAAAIGLTAASESSEVLTASGTLDVLRYGRLLRSRQLVGVRGAGTAFNGFHYVESITHNIERGKFTQNFSLSRNGLISTVPKVVP